MKGKLNLKLDDIHDNGRKPKPKLMDLSIKDLAIDVEVFSQAEYYEENIDDDLEYINRSQDS
jgi:hypothetical protein